MGKIRETTVAATVVCVCVCVPRLKIWKIVRRNTERSFRREAAMNSSAFPAQLLSSFPAFLAMFRKVNAFPSSTAEEKKKKRKKKKKRQCLSRICCLLSYSYLLTIDCRFLNNCLKLSMRFDASPSRRTFNFWLKNDTMKCLFDVYWNFHSSVKISFTPSAAILDWFVY